MSAMFTLRVNSWFTFRTKPVSIQVSLLCVGLCSVDASLTPVLYVCLIFKSLLYLCILQYFTRDNNRESQYIHLTLFLLPGTHIIFVIGIQKAFGIGEGCRDVSLCEIFDLKYVIIAVRLGRNKVCRKGPGGQDCLPCRLMTLDAK
jgi:hypothetical protein